MKPKEKAKELVINFSSSVQRNDISLAKHVAEVCVNQILSALEQELLELYDSARTCDINKKLQEYYLEVKKEIEEYE